MDWRIFEFHENQEADHHEGRASSLGWLIKMGSTTPSDQSLNLPRSEKVFPMSETSKMSLTCWMDYFGITTRLQIFVWITGHSVFLILMWPLKMVIKKDVSLASWTSLFKKERSWPWITYSTVWLLRQTSCRWYVEVAFVSKQLYLTKSND